MYKFLCIFLFLLSSLNAFEPGFGEEYYKIRDSKEKKAAFVKILLPKIQKAQEEILSDRAFIKIFFKKFLFTNSYRSRKDIIRLIKLSKKYRISQMYNEHEYLDRIDIIPTALVLAQSAVESAWGESRFAREGNNIFGEWTWGKRGIVPSERAADAKHKLRIFDSLDESIARYMLNLNRHYSYKEFRRLRADYRAKGEVFTGLKAATTMTNYSQIREAYNHLLIKVIKVNGFMRYERTRPMVLAAR